MVSILDFKKYTKKSYEAQESAGVYLWGSNNEYPQYLYDCIQGSSLLYSILRGSIDFTMGNSFNASEGVVSAEFLQKIITDRWYFGGFAFQVCRNSIGDIVELKHVDIRYIRINSGFDYCTLYNRDMMVECELPIFDKETPVPLSVYYYKGTATRDVYPIPDYSSAVMYAEIQSKIGEFHYNTLENNFNVSAIINFNNGIPSAETKKDIEDKLRRKFSGTTNAGKFLCIFNDSSDRAASVERLSSDDFDTKYQAIQETCERNIFTSLRAAPQLFGLSISTGFQAIEYEQAFKLYIRTCVIPKQSEVELQLKQVLGDDFALTFEQFSM